MDGIPIPYVKGEEVLAEDLRLVVRLDAQSLSRVERSETFLQFAKDILVHGITSPKSARPSMGAPGPARLFRVFLSADCLGARRPEIFRLFSSTWLGVVEIRYELDVAFGSFPDVCAVLHQVRLPSERTSPAARCTSEKCCIVPARLSK